MICERLRRQHINNVYTKDTVQVLKLKYLFWLKKGCETYVTDFLAALVSLILWGFQNRGELVLGPLILLPVLPLIEE